MTVRPHPIVGTWSLQSFAERDIKTNALSYPMGEMPKAAVIYTASGHVATIFTATGRSAPAGRLPGMKAGTTPGRRGISRYPMMCCKSGRHPPLVRF
jgi:hypothetical protein